MTPAEKYVRCGLAIVPIPHERKGPVAKGWNEARNVITSVTDAADLTGNIGLAHAYSTPPTMALDIDDLPKARAWLAERGIDLDELLDADDAVQIQSGRHGRAKILYRQGPAAGPLASVAIKERVLISGEEIEVTVLEFRCATSGGLTVQDVLPPSIHPDTGQPYRWGGKGDWRAIPTIPAPLLAVWQQELASRAAKRECPKSPLSLFRGVDDTPRQRARLQDMLRYISADCSYERYRNIVWSILSLGWHDGVELAEKWCRTAPHRFDELDFWNVVNSHDQRRSPAFGTIHHYACTGGWNG